MANSSKTRLLLTAVLLLSVDVSVLGAISDKESRWVTFASPSHLRNINGESRTVLQLEDVNQYFATHHCSVKQDCDHCICTQELSFFVAVVLKAGLTAAIDVKDTELDYFVLDGCCKCV